MCSLSCVLYANISNMNFNLKWAHLCIFRASFSGWISQNKFLAWWANKIFNIKCYHVSKFYSQTYNQKGVSDELREFIGRFIPKHLVTLLPNNPPNAKRRHGFHVKQCLYDDGNTFRSIISAANEMNLINLCLFIKNTLKKKVFSSTANA